jgi:hypothetical protein
MIGLILNIIASILKWALQYPCYIYGSIVSLSKGEFNEWNKDLALSKDRYGNVLIEYLANQVLIKSNGYKFGNPLDTISKVLGKNKATGTLTYLGFLIAYVLNKLDKNHVENAVK